jgi:hypothetical protein
MREQTLFDIRFWQIRKNMIQCLMLDVLVYLGNFGNILTINFHKRRRYKYV